MNEVKPPNRKKYMILCPILPHYRMGIYNALSQSKLIQFFFYADKKDIFGIKSIPFTSEFISKYNWINAKKIGFYSPKLRLTFFQTNVFKGLFRKNLKGIIATEGLVYLSNCYLPLIAKLLGKKFFLWGHGLRGSERGISLKVKLWHIKISTGMFLYGYHAKNLLIEHGIPEEKLHIIYNSLNYDEQLPLRKLCKPSDVFKNHFQNNDPVIVFIGRLVENKKLDMLVKAWQLLLDKDQSCNLVFIGAGDKQEELESMIATSNKSRCWFYGASYDEEQNAQLLYNADVCVSPGNVGLTAMHTMMFGTPVITHDDFNYQMPEFEAIETGKSGNFFKKDDIEALTTSIEQWLFHNKYNRDEIRSFCYEIMDTKYNPHHQKEIFEKVLG